MTDSYKLSHFKQYPKGTTKVFSYFESRQTDTPITFFGLQYFIKQYLEGVVITPEEVDEAKAFVDEHMGREDSFNYEGWMTIATELGGKLPLEIKSVQEGKTITGRNVLFTVENTDPRFYWLTNYMETLLCQVWYPTTVATNSRLIRETLVEYNEETSDSDKNEVANFQCHDFGFRGVSSVETAGLGAAGHMIWFLGTDTLQGITLAKQFYNAGVIGYSIPASEHSTMTAWLREEDAMENMLDQYPTGMIACVSDSYDIMNAVNNIWGDKLRDKILNRDGRLVVRPDSGDPVVTTLKVMEALWNKFGGETNSKGYKVLHPNIRMIQGDGVDREMIGKILENFKKNGFSSENIAFGSGGGLLQKFNRDTFKFAFKCSMIEIDGEVRDVRKTPMEFNKNGEYVKSSKYSKSGRLQLIERPGGTFDTIDTNESDIKPRFYHLKTIFKNGELVDETTFDEIRQTTMFA